MKHIIELDDKGIEKERIKTKQALENVDREKYKKENDEMLKTIQYITKNMQGFSKEFSNCLFILSNDFVKYRNNLKKIWGVGYK